MSGIVGIVSRDGAPVDIALLQRMTDSLAFRGPDEQRIWANGSVGFGHAMLRTSTEANSEIQPACLDERFWIAADARLDDRAGLIGKLRALGRSCSKGTPDSELILHAYAAWSDACVERLFGDFGFAIWDAVRKRVFCARDQFGVKQFYYARTPNTFIFSNTLNCLRLHPEISNRLNDTAIADFLLFDFNCDQATTSFADIARLPAGHTLGCGRQDISVKRYWTLSFQEEIRYKKPHEYVEHFDGLMTAALRDRLTADTAGVLMSGGLDSPVVAAYAQRYFKGNGTPEALHAYTEVFDRLLPHEERQYAGMVANALGIPIHFRSADEMKLYDVFDDPGFNWPEPVHLPWGTSTYDQMREMALRSRVALTGYGADPALSSSLSSHFRGLLSKKRFGRLLGDLFSYMTAEGRPSRFYLHTRWRRLSNPDREGPKFPSWINENLEKGLQLRERWEVSYGERIACDQAIRPGSYEALLDATWPNLFEGLDPGVTRLPVEVRHPFFDLGVLNFLLALPALPWCSDKELLRQAMRDVLPPIVRLRRKSPLLADPLPVLLEKPASAWVDGFEATSGLEQYVVRSRIPHVQGETDGWKTWVHLRPLSLNFWLHRLSPSGCK